MHIIIRQYQVVVDHMDEVVQAIRDGFLPRLQAVCRRLSPARGEMAYFVNGWRPTRHQPFSCAAGEGGAKRRMRGRRSEPPVPLP